MSLTDLTRRSGKAKPAKQGLVVLGLMAVLAPAPSAAGSEAVAAAGPVRWVDNHDTYLTESVLFDVNDDGIPDVITVSGDRNFFWWSLVPPGNPMAGLTQARNTIHAPATGLRALDGATGDLLWETQWQAATLNQDKSIFDFLNAVALADLDGDGDDELLVLRASHRAQEARSTGLTYHTTVYDPMTGAVRWNHKRHYGPDLFSHRQLEVFSHGGRTMAFVTNTEWPSSDVPRTRVELVEFSRTGPRTTWKLPWRRGWVYADATVLRGAIHLFVSRIDTVPGDGYFDMVPAEVEALRFPSSRARPQSQWRRSADAGDSVLALGGRRAVVLIGKDKALLAYDAVTGKKRWSFDIPWGRFYQGAMASTHIDSDGQADVIVSPSHGSAAWEGDLTSEIIALDGRTGTPIWRRLEAVAKFGAWSLSVQGSPEGRVEVIGSFAHQDGFAAAQYDDDPGLVGTYDAATGARLCRFSTDRMARVPLATTTKDGDHLLFAPTVGGHTYAFSRDEPFCGATSNLP